MRKLLRLSGLLVMLLTTSLANADGLAALQHFNQNVNHLSGQFKQQVKNSKTTKKTSGQFAISRPHYFKWEYQTPYQQIIVGDGKFLWMYDVDLAQVVKKKQTTLDESPAAILSNKNALNKVYNVKNDGSEAGIDYIVATPKKEDSGYQYIRLGFKNNTLAKMTLKDSFGNLSTIDFYNISTKSLKTTQFKFIPPKGVDILDE